MEIRLAEKNDVEAVLALYLEVVQGSYISHGEVLDGITVDFSRQKEELPEKKREAFRIVIAEDHEKDCLWVARENNELIGFLYGGITAFRDDGQPYAAVISDMGIDYASRQKGVGKQLVDAFIDWAKQKDCTWIHLESGIHNDSAHHFFESQGFVKTSCVFMKPLKEGLAMP